MAQPTEVLRTGLPIQTRPCLVFLPSLYSDPLFRLVRNDGKAEKSTATQQVPSNSSKFPLISQQLSTTTGSATGRAPAERPVSTAETASRSGHVGIGEASTCDDRRADRERPGVTEHRRIAEGFWGGVFGVLGDRVLAVPFCLIDYKTAVISSIWSLIGCQNLAYI